jgi:hypothetical protein
MKDSLVQFSKFSSLFDKASEVQTASLSEIQSLERILQIKLPEDFKLFMNNYGTLWTPHILNIIVDNEIEMDDIQQFWSAEEILEDNKSGITNQIEVADLIPFASDCMGNIFAFKSFDLKMERQTANVYFFDLDFNEMRLVANSFTALIEDFNGLI